MQITSLQNSISQFAVKTPDKVAIEWGSKKITYDQLEQYSNKIANFLIANSVEDKKIPVIMDKSIDIVACILGIIKSGNIFVPIDPNYPTNRIKMILNEVDSDWVMAQSEAIINKLEILGDKATVGVLIIGAHSEALDSTANKNTRSISFDNEQCSLIKDDISNKHCYIYFTSGSTGKPKGILGRHRSLCHFIQWEIQEFGIDKDFRISQLTSPSFDPFLRDVFVPLCAGGTLCIPEDKEIILNPEKLISWIEDSKISLIHMVPVLFRNMVSNLKPEAYFTSLKYILLAGELLRGNDIKRFVEIYNERIQLVNIYGPTETTLAKFFYPIKKEDVNKTTIPVGKPITFTEALILDNNLNKCLVNVVGEIYIRTPFISSGYFNDGDLTKKTFIKNPHGNNEKDIIYKTGDLGKLLSDGNIEVLGRADNQVKIRGVRIELAEIEAVLLNHSLIKNVVVSAKNDIEGNKYLCAYIILNELPQQNNVISELEQIKEYLKQQIPDHMVPSYFMQVQKFPLTPNGKIDRNNLPEPDSTCSTSAMYEAPRNILEEELVNIWRDILKVQQIGINDNFFNIGGHSLKAANMLLAVIKRFNIEIPLKTVFQHPTIKEFVEIVKSAQQSMYLAISTAPQNEHYPLSSAQKRLYALQAFESNNISYNIQKKVSVYGNLDIEVVKKVFNKIIQRHESLRTSFKIIGNEIVQIIHENIVAEIQYLNASQGGNIDAFEKKFVREFDLSKAPLIRMGIIEIGQSEYILLIDMHHIISDGTSIAILLSEFIALYRNEELSSLKIQYKDYAVWQNQLVKSDSMKRQEEYWLKTFENDVPVISLPTDYPRPSIQSFEGHRLYFSLGKETVQSIHGIIKETGSTLYMVLLAFFNLLLSKYTNQEDIIIGSPIAGRHHADLQNIIGMFVNTLAMRNYPQNNKTFRQFLLEVKENALRAYENQDYQFEELVEKLNIRRDISRNPLFDVMFVMQNIEVEETRLEELTFKSHNTYNNISKLDITLQAIENGDVIDLSLEYCSKLFKKETIQRMSEHMKNIISEIAVNIDKKISDINMLDTKEEEKLLYEFNDTNADYPKNKTIHQLFEEQVEKTPENVAVVFEHKQLTYRELNNKANQLAKLLRDKGVQPDTIVGMVVERSTEMIVGILGILKAGGAYLPIDPEYPNDRIMYTLRDSGTRILLTQQNFKDTLDFGGDIILLDNMLEYKQDYCNLPIVNKPEDIAYVIYTSGTTGKPKGAIIEHRNVVRLMFNDKMQFDFKDTDVWTMFHSYCFDFSVWEMYGALLYGGKLVVIPRLAAKDVWEYLRILKQKKVTVLNQTPSAFYRLIEEALKSGESNLSIRYVVFGGEALKPIMLKEFTKKYPQAKLINMYGITETTVHVTYKEITEYEIENNISNIGKPIPTLTAYIMNKSMRLMPIGSAGELCIGGDGLGRGYLNRPELTAEKFVMNPYKSTERLYKSGDLARILPNGEIEYLGRIDQQVKIRGFRIELGEIENRLLEKEEVQEAVVIAKEDSYQNSYLCAYYVINESLEQNLLTISELREYLLKQLPDYMIPSYFIKMDKIPLTVNGKVDKRKLLEVEKGVNTSSEYVAPTNNIEKKLVCIWENVLEIDRVGINDNFFELGGHSLKATSMIANIHKELNVQVPLKEIFKAPTIKGLSNYIKGLSENTYVSIEPLKDKEHYEVSAAQERLYILHQMSKSEITYNMPGIFVMEGALDVECLKTAFKKLIDRHEVFRTYFELMGEEIIQKIQKEVHIDISIQTAYEHEIEYIAKQFVKPFDLGIAPLLRVGLIKLHPESHTTESVHILMLDMHHIISDGISVGLLVDEFLKLYEGVELSRLKIQYKDYAAWLNSPENIERIEQQGKYWLDLLKDKHLLLDMPLDKERLSTQTFRGDTLSLILDNDITNQMQNLAISQNTTLNTVLMSFYSILLSKYSGQQEVIIGSTVTNRGQVELQNVIGPFINFIPIKSTINKDMSIIEFIDCQKHVVEDAYNNQEYPFDKLVEKLRTRTESNRNPIFDTMLIYHNELENNKKVTISGLKISQYPFKKKTSTLDFKLDVYQNKDNSLNCILEYNTDLFEEETMLKFIQHYKLTIEKLLNDLNQKVSELDIFTIDEKSEIGARRKANIKASNTISLAVTATFTPEPIEEYINWWCEKANRKVNISFASYNQVFQEIFDPESIISTNTGINLILVRFEDWIRNLDGADKQKCEILESNYESLVQALQSKNIGIPYIIAIFPTAVHLKLSSTIINCIEKLKEKWFKALKLTRNVNILDLREAANMYGVKEIFNEITDKTGHMPFSDEFYAVIGTLVARKINAISGNPFKVIAVDCDNTLWKGICGEEGTLGITINKQYLELQKLLIKKQEEGMLIVLCSKNNEEDVWEVFDKNPQMLLKREHLAGWRIDWKPKFENVKQLAEELNLGIDSFMFIDDSNVECYQMMVNNPEVLTLQIPEDSRQIPLFLKHIWAFDKEQVTAEDRMRTKSYQAERQRKEIQKNNISMEDFLRELKPKIYANPITQNEISRVSQLTQRTNQFNLSNIRRTEKEIQELIDKQDTVCWTIEVEDKFGAYGLTGLLIFEKKQNNIFLDSYLLSCRVLGRGVENAILVELAKYCLEKGIKKIQADFYPTQKNQQVKTYLEKAKWNKLQDTSEFISYEIEATDIEDTADYVECIYGEHCTKVYNQEVTSKEINEVASELEIRSAEDEEETIKANLDVHIDSDVQAELLHVQYILPLKYYTGAKLLQLPTNDVKQLTDKADYQAPTSEIEKKLEVIWQKILKIEKISINDDFFYIGGHSLKAASLVAKIHKELNVEVSLGDIFAAPTIKTLAEHIEEQKESKYASIEVIENQDKYMVSSAQKRLYTLQQFDTQSTSYNMPAIFIVDGELDIERLEASFNKLIQRHESLRTSFDIKEQEIVQVINKDISINIELINANQSDEIKDVIASQEISEHVKEFVRTFDLRKAPLLRVGLIVLQKYKYILMFDMHHIISDGTSMGILIRELMSLYQGEVLSELKLQYKDYAAWQKKIIKADLIKKQEEYWIKSFEGDIPVINLPIDYPRPAIQSFEGDKIYFQIEGKIVKGLRRIAQECGATMYMILLSAINVLLSKYSGQDDIVIGSPIAGRPHADLDNIIGMFVNTLAMRNYPEGSKTFVDFLGEVKVNALKAFENQDYQFEELVEKLNVRRDMSRNPLFDVMFGLQNTDTEKLDINGITFNKYNGQKTISKFDITLDATEIDEIIEISLEYCTKLFKKETILRMVEHFKNILTSIINNPKAELKNIEILSKQEEEQILKSFNSTYSDYPKAKTLQQIFEEQVNKNPNNIAVVHGDLHLTYEELNTRANRLARLLKSKGVETNTIVGIMVERSLEMIVGIIAILKAGGAYLPLDATFPKERIEYMIKDCQCKIVLTQVSSHQPTIGMVETIDIYNEELYKGDGSNIEQIEESNNLAYIMYTSGSTGEPKGILTTHYNISRIAKATNYINLTSSDRVLQLSNYAFDGSTFDIFGALLNGSILHIVDKTVLLDIEKLGKYIEDNDITVFFATTALFNTIIDVIPQCLRKIRKVLFGGERVSILHAKKALKYLGKNRVLHVYGPTESTVFATYSNIDSIEDKAVTIPIGKPLSNTTVYVLDKNNKLQPIGVPGELCIGGDGLARGYLNRTELTSEKFIENPFEEGSKIYKSGDLAKWLPDGNIEFLDRMDGQVKIRGFRIELGEIESKLIKCNGILEAVVIAHKENGSNKHLCAYVTADIQLNIAELKSQLSKELPDYMVPSYIIQLEKLPLNQNGKVDTKALPQFEAIDTEAVYEPPRNDVEEKLALIWQEVMKLERVGIFDNFFALGGDSIKAIQVSARIQRYGYKIQVGDIIKYPTIEELGKYADKCGKLAEQGLIIGEIELTPIQHWFFEQKYPNKHHWNHAVMLHKKEGFHETVLKSAFNKIIEHHDMLRGVYHEQSDVVVQKTRGIYSGLYTLEVYDFCGIKDSASKITEAAEKIQSSIDLQNGPLVKLGLFKTEEGDHLLIVIHHLVIDGVSWRILFEDLTTSYKQLQEGKDIVLPAKTTSFKEWAETLKTYANSEEVQQELEYWTKIAGSSATLINKDATVEFRRVKDNKTVSIQITEEETENLLREVNKAYKTEINDILLTALGIAISEWAGMQKVAISLEGHGRENIKDTDVSRTIGWFTSVYPVMLDICNTEQTGHQIKVIKEMLRGIPQKGMGYGAIKYLLSAEKRKALSFNLEPEISFNYLGQFDDDIKTEVFSTSTISAGRIMNEDIENKYAISIDGMVIDGRLNLNINYNINEFNEETIKQLAEILKTSLKHVIEHCLKKEEMELTPSDISTNMFDMEELDELFDMFEDQINQ